jgi:hypothetical protein
LRSPCPEIPEVELGLRRLYAYIGDYEQIGHRLGLLHDDLLHSLDITDPTAEGIDDVDILDVRDSAFDVAETFHPIPEALIMLLPDGLQGLCC